MAVETLQEFFRDYPWWVYTATIILAALLLGGLVFIITRRYLVRALAILTERSDSELDDLILKNVVAGRLAYITPLLVFYALVNLVPEAVAWLQPF